MHGAKAKTQPVDREEARQEQLTRRKAGSLEGHVMDGGEAGRKLVNGEDTRGAEVQGVLTESYRIHGETVGAQHTNGWNVGGQDEIQGEAGLRETGAGKIDEVHTDGLNVDVDDGLQKEASAQGMMAGNIDAVHMARQGADDKDVKQEKAVARGTRAGKVNELRTAGLAIKDSGETLAQIEGSAPRSDKNETTVGVSWVWRDMEVSSVQERFVAVPKLSSEQVRWMVSELRKRRDRAS